MREIERLDDDDDSIWIRINIKTFTNNNVEDDDDLQNTAVQLQLSALRNSWRLCVHNKSQLHAARFLDGFMSLHLLQQLILISPTTFKAPSHTQR